LFETLSFSNTTISTDQFDVVVPLVRIVDAFREGEAEEVVIDVEQAAHHRLQGKVVPQDLLVDGVPGADFMNQFRL
jgi:hypothetical protein